MYTDPPRANSNISDFVLGILAILGLFVFVFVWAMA